MHPLREAMLDQMRLRGHSPRTQQSYLNAVSLLSRHYRWMEESACLVMKNIGKPCTPSADQSTVCTV